MSEDGAGEVPWPDDAHRRRDVRPLAGRLPHRLLAGSGIALLLLIVAGSILALLRYVPALEEARALQADLAAMASRAQSAGMEIDRPTIDALGRDLAAARLRRDRLAGLLSDDPLVGLARALPPTASDVRGADVVIGAAGDLLDAADQVIAIGRSFVEIKEAQAARTGTPSTLAQLVELMASSRDSALAAQAALGRARAAVNTIPHGLAGPVEGARNEMTERLDTYAPLLDAYVAASARLPAILGWEGPRRYLVLTQDPAELRSTGGFIGSYGIVVFDRGRLTQRTFQDIATLDYSNAYPFMKPPTELANYLLGPTQSWQLADANWSPDFPTSAQDALRLYANESGDTGIDGVLAITTYTIDELLKITGPITIPEYGATIASGETTLKTLQLTRVARNPGDNRKAFLSAFADRLFGALLSLPPRLWGDLPGHAEAFRSGRLLLAWFVNADDQALATRAGFDGAVRQDPGDYIYPVDSNVAPASKLNVITTRSLRLDVRIDLFGNAKNTLDVTWDNGIDTPAGSPYRDLPRLQRLRTLGMFFRLLVPDRSRVDAVSGGGAARLTTPSLVGDEAGRTVVGAYVRVPPGTTSLRFAWTSPYAADADETGGVYRLTMQMQPGLRPGPLTLAINVPEGFRITAASEGLTVAGRTATLATAVREDLELVLRYERSNPP